jgi:membrane protease YdiL (CAAX protease family)
VTGDDFERAVEASLRASVLPSIGIAAVAFVLARRLLRRFAGAAPPAVPWGLHGLLLVFVLLFLNQGLIAPLIPEEGARRGRALMLYDSIAKLTTVGLVLAFLAVRFARAPFDLLGLRRAGALRALAFGALVYLAWFPVQVGILFLNRLLFPAADLQRALAWMQEDRAPGAIAFYLGTAAVLVPFAEEVLFRGFGQAGMRRLVGPAGALLLTALLFGVAHAALAVLLPTFVLGFVLSWLYERTGSLAAPIAAHALHNAVTILFLFAHR